MKCHFTSILAGSALVLSALSFAGPANAAVTTELDADASGLVTITEPGHYVDTDGTSFRTVSIASDDVTLDGLTFDGAGTTAAGAGVRNAAPGLSNIAVLNSGFSGYTGRAIAFGFAEGIGQKADRGSNFTVAGNTLDDMAGNAATSIAVFDTDGVSITDNDISNANTAFTGRRGINLDSNSSVVVRGNTVSLGASGTLGGPSYPVFSAAPWAIQVSMSNAPVLDHSIMDNTLSGSYDGIVVLSQRDVTGLKIVANDIAAGFGVRLNAGSATSVTSPLTFSAIEVSGNRIDATAFDGISYGVRLQDSPSITYRDVRITGNISVATTASVVVGQNANLDKVLVRGNR